MQYRTIKKRYQTKLLKVHFWLFAARPVLQPSAAFLFEGMVKCQLTGN